MVDIEDFDKKFKTIVSTKEFAQAKEMFKKAEYVFYFGHGGNMSIAEHAAIDTSRLTDKNVFAPGGGVIVTSIQGDTNFNDWMMNWLDIRTRGLDKSKCLVIGLSCSTTGASSNCVATALNCSAEKGIPSVLWAAAPKEKGIDDRVVQVIQYAKYYHTSEILSLAMTYELIHSAGFDCPSIAKKAHTRRFETLGIEQETKSGQVVQNKPEETSISDQHVPPGMESQLNNLAIDFDGVIHTFDKGWHDGTCYGDPKSGSLDAIKELSKNWNIIVFSAKVRPDRPLVNGKTGLELVTEWLAKHDVLQYVSDITHEKPRAQFYIDDKAIHFDNNWSDIVGRLSS